MEKVELKVYSDADPSYKEGEFNAEPFMAANSGEFMQHVIDSLATIKQKSDEFLTSEIKRVSGDATKR